MASNFSLTEALPLGWSVSFYFSNQICCKVFALEHVFLNSSMFPIWISGSKSHQLPVIRISWMDTVTDTTSKTCPSVSSIVSVYPGNSRQTTMIITSSGREASHRLIWKRHLTKQEQIWRERGKGQRV